MQSSSLHFDISGLCYDSKMFQVHQVLCIPSWMAKFFSWTLEPIFSSSEPTSEARIGMGATLDIQRQQRMELLDRQLMFSQFAQGRRQRQQQQEVDPAKKLKGMRTQNDPENETDPKPLPYWSMYFHRAPVKQVFKAFEQAFKAVSTAARLLHFHGMVSHRRYEVQSRTPVLAATPAMCFSCDSGDTAGLLGQLSDQYWWLLYGHKRGEEHVLSLRKFVVNFRELRQLYLK
ncbi:hypothetical protein P7K49_000238 [Saguinus oedipus]|uniref:Uncharacterized protein n=1 Tax=Saguinus oedipus TaxID=9490 RepID=A0ABQ9WEQ8_SAGOE|nr:hypothetical protein P7K49_000238 [Saguinus oedipus]